MLTKETKIYWISWGAIAVAAVTLFLIGHLTTIGVIILLGICAVRIVAGMLSVLPGETKNQIQQGENDI